MQAGLATHFAQSCASGGNPWHDEEVLAFGTHFNGSCTGERTSR
jgi:hypothetical protein